jgi:hypothetical protein
VRGETGGDAKVKEIKNMPNSEKEKGKNVCTRTKKKIQKARLRSADGHLLLFAALGSILLNIGANCSRLRCQLGRGRESGEGGRQETKPNNKNSRQNKN